MGVIFIQFWCRYDAIKSLLSILIPIVRENWLIRVQTWADVVHNNLISMSVTTEVSGNTYTRGRWIELKTFPFCMRGCTIKVPSFCTFSYIFFLWLEKMLKPWKRWFQPAKGVQSTHLLTEIHNKQHFSLGHVYDENAVKFVT